MIGTICTWESIKGIGFITSQNKRYFLHISRIRSLQVGLEEPFVGCLVSFTPSAEFRRFPADRLSATEADVYVDQTALDAALQSLAGDDKAAQS